MIRRTEQAAFTLVELMISIALVVVLMLGITKVFSLTSQTAGATNQMSSTLRDARAAQAEMSQDFSTALRDGSPFMTIYSVSQPAFRNKADRDSDRDFDATDTDITHQWAKILTVDVDGNNKEGELGVPGEIISPATYNYRNHRLDMITFFSRHRFERQTGGAAPASVTPVTDGPLISQMNSNEAYLWYGHLWLPNNSPTNPWPAPTGALNSAFPRPTGAPSITFPGQCDPAQQNPTGSVNNPNNYYATQWILGRVATLLVPPDPTTRFIRDRSNANQHFNVADYTNLPMSPLQANSYDAFTDSVAPNINNRAALIQESRYDLAGTSVDIFRNHLFSMLQAAPGTLWFSNLMGYADVLNPNFGPTLFTGGRFQANPFFSAPIDAQKLSRQSPIFLPACTQFIVEYAGDYLSQDTNPTSPTFGQVINAFCPIDVNNLTTPPTLVTPPATDGQIDFVVTWDDANNNGVIDASEANTVKRHVRWYGLARNAETSDDTATAPIITGAAANLDASRMPDVVPLRDVIRSAAHTGASAPGFPTSGTFRGNAANFVGASFERYLPTVRINYAAPSASGSALATDGMNTGDSYSCAWGPSDPKPKMIRITMTIDDPNGKLPDGQTYQFIFTLP